MTYTSTITSKGTITLPAEFRKRLRLREGQQVSISVHDGAVIIKPPLDIEDIRKHNQEHLRRLGIDEITDDLIDSTMAQAAIERYERSRQ